LEKIGEFIYDPPHNDGVKRAYRDWKVLPNGAKYCGEW
jgi:hypothetical protein